MGVLVKQGILCDQFFQLVFHPQRNETCCSHLFELSKAVPVGQEEDVSSSVGVDVGAELASAQLHLVDRSFYQTLDLIQKFKYSPDR